MTIAIADIIGRQVPFQVRYGKDKPATVVGFGSAGLAPLCSGVRDTIVHFKPPRGCSSGGWLWLPDLLRHYDLVEHPLQPRGQCV